MTFINKVRLFLFLLAIFPYGSIVGRAAEEGPQLIPLIAAIANSEKYNGRQVVLDGYLSFRQEDVAIYLGEEAYRNSLSTSAIWLNLSQDELKELQKHEHEYVRISGLFDTSDKGNRSLYPASLRAVKFISNIKTYSFLCRLTGASFFCN